MARYDCQEFLLMDAVTCMMIRSSTLVLADGKCKTGLGDARLWDKTTGRGQV